MEGTRKNIYNVKQSKSGAGGYEYLQTPFGADEKGTPNPMTNQVVPDEAAGSND